MAHRALRDRKTSSDDELLEYICSTVYSSEKKENPTVFD
jgi:hypothetical protein